MPAKKYNHIEIEQKWSQKWQEDGLYKPEENSSKPKKYILDAFAYPSGVSIHAGHSLGYTAADILSRHYRLLGYLTINPIGYDSFGLPAESYAIKTGIHPSVNTEKTISFYQEQITRLGIGTDLTENMATHRPEYYKWTQWFFGFLYNRGLAYKKEALVNWDPVDQTVLANEQVLPDGTAERSGAMVEQKMMNQWFFKITDFVEDRVVAEGPNKGRLMKGLLNGLDDLLWPESTKQQQRNWIGKSSGAEVNFEVESGGEVGLGFNLEEDCALKSPLDKRVDFEERGELSENLPYLPYNADLKERARELINNQTETEKLVWHNILNNDKLKYRFLRQKPILNYILDFYSSELKLAIEIDGDSHSQNLEYDKRRTEELNKLGIEVIRFTNEEVSKNLAGVFESIKQKCESKGKLLLDNPPVQSTDPLTSFETSCSANKSFVNGLSQETKSQPKAKKITVFTTRIDTLFGVTYLVLAPENEIVNSLVTEQYRQEVEKYIENAKHKTQLQRTDLNKYKTGVFTGSYAINPINGKKIPIWIADYVISTYGTGAVMGVPGHDERDYEFAKKYSLDIEEVIAPLIDYPLQEDKSMVERQVVRAIAKHWSEDKYLAVVEKKNDNICTLIGSGIDEGEEPKKGILREIQEESGYSDFRVCQVLDLRVYKTFFNKKKDRNQKNTIFCAYVELNSANQQTISTEEQELIEYKWLTKEELKENMSGAQDLYFVDRILYDKIFTEYGILYNSWQFDGMTSEEAKVAITRFGEEHGWAKEKITYKLRDWLVSRQRYWGSPIPIVYTVDSSTTDSNSTKSET